MPIAGQVTAGEVTAIEVIVLVGDEVESLVQMSKAVGPVRQAMRDADDDLRARLLEGVRTALAEKTVDGELRLTSGAFVASARA